MLSTASIEIKHISAAVPKNCIQLDSFVGQWDWKYLERAKALTGISKFHRATGDLTGADLCVHATNLLFEKAQTSPAEIDALIFVSSTFDYSQCPTGPSIASQIGLKKQAIVIDLHSGCSGYVYGLLNAALLLQSKGIKKCLLLNGETISKFLDPADSSTQLIFSDAGTSSLIELSQNQERNSRFILGSNGNSSQIIFREEGGAKRTVDADPYLRMNGMDILGLSSKVVPDLISELLAAEDLTIEEIDGFIFHQASLKILELLSANLKLPKEKVHSTLAKYGNSGGPSLPITLLDYKLKSNINAASKNTVLCAFGVGLSWGAVNLDCSQTIAYPMLFV